MTVTNGGGCRLTVTEAVEALTEASYLRASAASYGHDDPEHAAARVREADALEADADDALTPAERLIVGRGGELVQPEEVGPVRSSPDMLNAEASRERMELMGGKVALALDTAQAIGATNSAERMLGHQMAKAHELAMRLAGHAMRFANKAERFDRMDAHAQSVAANIEASRSANVAARLMEVFQRAMLTQDTLRNGRKQTVTVQHVTVQPGGQAVVAGSVAPRGRGD